MKSKKLKDSYPFSSFLKTEKSAEGSLQETSVRLILHMSLLPFIHSLMTALKFLLMKKFRDQASIVRTSASIYVLSKVQNELLSALGIHFSDNVMISGRWIHDFSRAGFMVLQAL